MSIFLQLQRFLLRRSGKAVDRTVAAQQAEASAHEGGNNSRARSFPMCLTTEAFAMFLNVIGLGLVSGDADTMIVHASTADVTWTAIGDHWCTTAPQNFPQTMPVTADPMPPVRN